MTPPKKAVEEEEPEAEVQTEAVDDSALPADVWIENAHIFGVAPEVVRAALSLLGEGPYNRDQVAMGIPSFLSRPVEQEG
jgi:hypothetical protein